MTTGLGPTDLIAIFTTLFSDVASVRAARLLPPMVSMHLGKEQIATEESPPRIVVVPTHNTYEYARVVGVQPMTGLATAINPPTFCTRWMHFDAHLWGDESPTPASPLTEQDLWYSFNSTIEIEREFLQAIARNLGNISNTRSGVNVRLGDSRWVQPSDQMRLGRKLVLSFSVGFPVTYEPFVMATPTSAAVDMKMVFLDGTSSDQGTVIVP